MRHNWVLFFLAVWGVGASAASSGLVFQVLGDRRGEVAPCGCPRVQLGGLARLVAFLDERKKRPVPFTVDTGNTFFALPQLPETREKQEVAKAELIADAYKMVGVDVLVPGPRDLALGKAKVEALAERAGLRLVATNLVDDKGQPLFAPFITVEKEGVKVGITAVVDSSHSFPVGLVQPPAESLKRAIAQLRSDGVAAVVLVAQDSTDIEALRPLGLDAVLIPPQEEGKALSILTWDPATKRTELQQHALDPSWDKPGRFAARYKDYMAEVRSLAVDKSTTFTVKPKGAFTSQAGVCRQCHQEQHDFWEKTKHASAYLVLFSKNEHFNPECISCHSLGYQEKGGYSDITAPILLVGAAPRKSGEIPFVENFMTEIFQADPTKGPLDSRLQPERYAKLKKAYHDKIHALQSEAKLEALPMGVQCEHCHGNRNGHPGAGFKKTGKVKKSTCTHCHAPPHDDSFNFADRKPKVSCPKIQRNAAF